MFRTCIGKLGRQSGTRKSQLPRVMYFRERLDESFALSYQKDFGSEAITEVNLRWGLVFINAFFAWYLKLHLCIYKVPVCAVSDFILFFSFYCQIPLLWNFRNCTKGKRRKKKNTTTNTQVMFTNVYDQLMLYETGQETVFLVALEGMVIIYNHYFKISFFAIYCLENM